MKLPDLLVKNPQKSVVALSALAGAVFLGFALLAQYIGGQHPCELCIAQRVPYAVIAVIGAVTCMRVSSPKKLHMVALLCALLFAVDGGIAVYHTGVELGVIKGPSGCTNNDKPGMTIEEMRAAIMGAQAVPCDQPMGYFLGLSMASWNAFAAFGSAFLVVYTLLWARKKGAA